MKKDLENKANPEKTIDIIVNCLGKTDAIIWTPGSALSQSLGYPSILQLHDRTILLCLLPIAFDNLWNKN